MEHDRSLEGCDAGRKTPTPLPRRGVTGYLGRVRRAWRGWRAARAVWRRARADLDDRYVVAQRRVDAACAREALADALLGRRR